MANPAVQQYGQAEMQLRSIRHIAASPLWPDRFVTASSDGEVALWSVAKRAPFSVFESVFDAGGQRVHALESSDGTLVVVAGNWQGPVVGYDAATGTAVWSRAELRHLQYLTPLGRGVVAAGFERGPLRVLDAATGETVATIRGAASAFPVDGESVLCIGRDSTIVLRASPEGQPCWTQTLVGFGVIDAAAAIDGAVLVGEAGGPLRLFASDGMERWRWSPPEGSHAVCVARNHEHDDWVAVVSFYEEGGPDALVTLGDEGELLRAVELPRRPSPVFVARGSMLVTTKEIVSVPEGETLWELDRAY